MACWSRVHFNLERSERPCRHSNSDTEMSILLLLFLIFALSYYYRLQIQDSHTAGRKIPGLPAVGQGTSQSIMFGMDPIDQAFMKMASLVPKEQNVGIFQTYFFGKHTIVVNDPNLIRELVKNHSTK